ncbi:hypothetical protein J4760_09870 [Salinicoccus sp. ID82-1]|uniref:Uncharacterized protein n=1 Tax=Salinicoccus cyprini TaxID=2493691 RepID=A0A558AVM3_9STAP|nr:MULTISPECIES: hypothetical protein [Salinicoccus]MCG1010323.1 hypothetical protein [Salinicoccus sp. ID82-1]TVT28286.1 hypothetical protein FO441_07700 [Salinicoccus cyprini]
MRDYGQTNIFDHVIKEDETFVIVVQEVTEQNGQLHKRVLREYPSLKMEGMKNLFDHLRDVYREEAFSARGKYFDITIYTNEDYAGDNIYAHVKRYRNSKEWTTTSK